jgi:hypothetical protein
LRLDRAPDGMPDGTSAEGGVVNASKGSVVHADERSSF